MTLKDIQQRLKELGHDPGPIDGAWGQKTMTAVAAAIGAVETDPGDPAWLRLARRELGTREVSGAGNNPTVIDYFADAAHPQIKQDAVPWCAAFVGAMLKRAGKTPSGSLMARSYLDWGKALSEPRLGCVVVFKRGKPPSGHVAFYLGHTSAYVRVLGGNQSDAVTIQNYRKDAVLGYRWPK